MSFVLILYFDWLLGPHKGQNFEKKKHSKIFSSETVKWMNPVLYIHVPDVSDNREQNGITVRQRDRQMYHAGITVDTVTPSKGQDKTLPF